MPYFHEANEAPFRADPELISPDRPPQLNEAVCGCRCGCGCYQGNEDGVKDGDGASTRSLDTLVASNNSETGEAFPPSSDGPENHVHVDLFETRRIPLSWDDSHPHEVRIGAFLQGNEGFRLGPHLLGIEDRPLRMHQAAFLQDYDDLPESMKNEPHDSEDHSVGTPEGLSVRCISPGPGLEAWTGLGAWTEGQRLGQRCGQRLGGYHFLATPLRLTPQRRFCRGLVASHLIVHDDLHPSEEAERFIEN